MQKLKKFIGKKILLAPVALISAIVCTIPAQSANANVGNTNVLTEPQYISEPVQTQTNSGAIKLGGKQGLRLRLDDFSDDIEIIEEKNIQISKKTTIRQGNTSDTQNDIIIYRNPIQNNNLNTNRNPIQNNDLNTKRNNPSRIDDMNIQRNNSARQNIAPYNGEKSGLKTKEWNSTRDNHTLNEAQNNKQNSNLISQTEPRIQTMPNINSRSSTSQNNDNKIKKLTIHAEIEYEGNTNTAPVPSEYLRNNLNKTESAPRSAPKTLPLPEPIPQIKPRPAPLPNTDPSPKIKPRPIPAPTPMPTPAPSPKAGQ